MSPRMFYCSISLEPLSLILKIFHSHVHLNEMMCIVKVSETLLQGHSGRSKVTFTKYLTAPYFLNFSDFENISH